MSEQIGALPSRMCSHPCNTPRSTVVLTATEQRLAGLADRHYILENLANLAHSLCADLVVPRPCDLLERRHNGGMAINCSVRWSRYFQLDGVSLAEESSPETERRVHELTTKPHGARIMTMRREGPATKWAMFRQRALLQQFDFAVNTTAAGNRFVWIIRRWFYEWSQALARHLQERQHWLPGSRVPPAFGLAPCRPVPCREAMAGGCRHVQLKVSKASALLRDEFLQRTRLYPGAFHTLHIRRGDRVRQCNTSIAAVLAYVGGHRSPMLARPAHLPARAVCSRPHHAPLPSRQHGPAHHVLQVRCSLMATSLEPRNTSGHRGRLPLVLFSDETRLAYRGKLLAALHAELGASPPARFTHRRPASARSGTTRVGQLVIDGDHELRRLTALVAVDAEVPGPSTHLGHRLAVDATGRERGWERRDRGGHGIDNYGIYAASRAVMEVAAGWLIMRGGHHCVSCDNPRALMAGMAPGWMGSAHNRRAASSLAWSGET